MQLEQLIKSSEVVSKSDAGHDSINIGSRFKVDFDGIEKDFEIVGANESDPLQGIISYDSPLAESFIGKRNGDEFEVEVPKGKIKCKILKIK